MDFKQIIMSRYAVKKFNGKGIDNKKIDEILEMIRMAPSSFNIQPWKIKIITDQKLKEKLKAVSWNQEQVTSCSHLLVFCADSDIIGRINKLEAQLKQVGMPQESLQAYIGMMRGAFKDMDESKRLSWAQRQTYLPLENALLGAKALGFDSCPMEGFDAVQYSRILGLPKNIVPTALCAIGYADDTPKPKLRFAKEEVFF